MLVLDYQLSSGRNGRKTYMMTPPLALGLWTRESFCTGACARTKAPLPLPAKWLLPRIMLRDDLHARLLAHTGTRRETQPMPLPYRSRLREEERHVPRVNPVRGSRVEALGLLPLR
jgi:hypothetical protein